MSASEIYDYLEVSTLCAYVKLQDEVRKLEVQGIADFQQLVNVTEEELDRWGITPLVKHALMEGNKLNKLSSTPQVAQSQGPLKEALDMILPHVKALVEKHLEKFRTDIEEATDRKLANFEKRYILEINVRPKKPDEYDFGDTGECATEPRDSPHSPEE